MNRRHVGIAAAVAAAAVLSACSNGAVSESRDWPTPSPVSAVAPVWQDVSGQGLEAPRDSTQYRAKYGSTPAPGIEIVHAKTQTPGDTVPCTLGPAVSSGYLTAGHCAKGFSPDQYLVGSPTGDLSLLGAAESVNGPVDTAVIETNRGPVTRIAHTWPVAGVLTPSGVRDLVPIGSNVCFDGAVSGVVCGKRVADRSERVAFDGVSVEGDSGAPVFVVDPTTRRAALVGILKGGNDVSSTAVYLEAALLATSTAARLDPTAEPFDGQGFSQRIAIK